MAGQALTPPNAGHKRSCSKTVSTSKPPAFRYQLAKGGRLDEEGCCAVGAVSFHELLRTLPHPMSEHPPSPSVFHHTLCPIPPSALYLSYIFQDSSHYILHGHGLMEHTT